MDDGRALGKKLYYDLGLKYIKVYRAVKKGVEFFYDKDYVTFSEKFAKEHAENNHVYHDEPFDVIYALISTDKLYHAYNPGEYFYSGKPLEGKVVYTSLGPDEFEGFDENYSLIKEQLRILIRENVKEAFKRISGDWLDYNDKTLWSEDNDAIPFFYYDSRLFIGKNAQSHYNIIIDSDTLQDKVLSMAEEEMEDEWELSEDDALQHAEAALMNDVQFNGRIWTDSKIITFWRYPSKDYLVSIVNDLNEELPSNINIDGSWLIALPKNIIKLKDYTDGQIPEEDETQHLDKWKQHIESPLNKQKDTAIGWGSKHKDYLGHRQIDREIGRAQQ